MAIIKGTVTPEASISGTVNVTKTVLAESNAEMIDARIGYNNEPFSTLGNAIRTQVLNLWNALEPLRTQIGSLWDAVNGKQPAGDYLTEETDPTVPAWAKAEVKPSYTADEVGATPKSHGTNTSNPHSVNYKQVGAVMMKKVWENASPTSTYTSQTVSVDLSDAEKVLIVFKPVNSSSMHFESVIPVGSQGQLFSILNMTSASDNAECTSRTANVSTTGVAFGNGYKKVLTGSTCSTEASRLIPVAIYAMKGVQK